MSLNNNHHQRIINVQRIQRQRRRIINIIFRRRAPINNNANTLSQINQFTFNKLQMIRLDPFANQLFNGSSFP